MPKAIQPHCVLLSELSSFVAAAAAAPAAAAAAGVTPPLVVVPDAVAPAGACAVVVCTAVVVWTTVCAGSRVVVETVLVTAGRVPVMAVEIAPLLPPPPQLVNSTAPATTASADAPALACVFRQRP